MKKNRLFWAIAGTVLIVTAVVVCVLLWSQLQAETPVQILDSQGNVLLYADSSTSLFSDSRWAYIDVALSETLSLLSEKYGCTLQEAEEHLFRDGLTIHTAFDSALFKDLEAALTPEEFPIGCAITDLQGNLLAVISTDSSANYAYRKTAPHSAFKPLSVYTPALEAGKITWASMYEDSPYGQTSTEDGNTVNWPANASGTYSMEPVTVSQGIAQSLNTLAVKCLASYGVDNSMAFLQDKLGIPLVQEQQAAELYGSEELLGSLALGYVEAGVSPIDMAGYYQIFSNGGSYLAPKAVTRIQDASGADLYVRQEQAVQVIRPATADLMNKLLQEVVYQGTGQAAACENVQTAGKTGTGDNFADNWFVGLTPSYSCAIWHGQATENQASRLFSQVISQIYSTRPKLNSRFVTHYNLFSVAYCMDSGQAASAGCSRIAIGYFPAKDTLLPCSLHASEK